MVCSILDQFIWLPVVLLLPLAAVIITLNACQYIEPFAGCLASMDMSINFGVSTRFAALVNVVLYLHSSAQFMIYYLQMIMFHGSGFALLNELL